MQDKITAANIAQVRQADLRGLMAISLQIYLMRFPVIAAIAALVNLPVNIYFTLYGPTVPDTPLGMLSYYPYLIVANLFSLLVLLAVAYIVELTIYAEQPGLNEAINHALIRWLPAVGTFLLTTLAVFSGLLVFVLPGIALSIYFFFDMHAVSLREMSLAEALRYSLDLVRGRWLQTLGRVLFVMFLVLTPSLFIQFSIVASGADLGATALILYDTLLDVISAFSLVAYTILFLNLDYGRQPEESEEADGTASA